MVSTYYPGSSDPGKRTEYTFDRFDPVVQYAVWNKHQTNLYRDNQQNILFKHELTAGDNVVPGNRFAYHYDGQGNISAVTKHSGQADKSYRYDAYGNILHPSNNAGISRNNYTLSQKQFDPEMELTYFGSRHYDAYTGTWLTQDRYRGDAFNPQSLHRYMYNYDSPQNYVDWYGYSPVCYSGYKAYPCGLESWFNTVLPSDPIYEKLFDPNGNITGNFEEQDYACSFPAGKFNEWACTKVCCVQHDVCYEEHPCNSSSWVGNILGIERNCQKCNVGAVQCIVPNIGRDDSCETEDTCTKEN